MHTYTLTHPNVHIYVHGSILTCISTHIHNHLCGLPHPCTHTHIHTLTCSHASHTRAHTHAHSQVHHTHVLTHTNTPSHTPTATRSHVHPDTYIRARTHTFTAVLTHVHTHTQTHSHTTFSAWSWDSPGGGCSYTVGPVSHSQPPLPALTGAQPELSDPVSMSRILVRQQVLFFAPEKMAPRLVFSRGPFSLLIPTHPFIPSRSPLTPTPEPSFLGLHPAQRAPYTWAVKPLQLHFLPLGSRLRAPGFLAGWCVQPVSCCQHATRERIQRARTTLGQEQDRLALGPRREAQWMASEHRGGGFKGKSHWTPRAITTWKTRKGRYCR